MVKLSLPLGAIGELIGAIGVIISLIYLSIQIRSNTSHLKFSSQQAVAEAMDRAFDPIYTEPSRSIWIRGHEDHAALSESDKMIFDALMMRQLTNLQNTTRAQRQGLVTEAQVNRTYRAFFRGLVESPGGSEWFKDRTELFDSELVKFLSDDA